MIKLLQHIVVVLLISQSLIYGQRSINYNDDEVDGIVRDLIQNSDQTNKLNLLTTQKVMKQFNTTDPQVYVPGYLNTDGAVGPRGLDILTSTQFPSGPCQVATFNPDLAYELGVAFGRQAQANGFKLLWGPGVNGYRIPIGGRNFEYYVGEDPFLGSQIVPEIVKGCQSQKIMATIKHYVANDEEINRFNIQVYVDERPLREIYLKPFEETVKKAKPASVMEAYNGVNGEFMAQNKYLLQTVLKDEWGFEGFIISDQASIKDGNASLANGLDLELNDNSVFQWNTTSLQAAIDIGTITQEQLEEKVFRVLKQAVRFRLLEQQQTNFAANFPKLDAQANDVALRSAREGIVLLRNDINLLPLDKSKPLKIAVLGRTAPTEPPMGSGSAHIYPIAPISELEGLRNIASSSGSQVDFLPAGYVKYDNNSFKVAPDSTQGLYGEYYQNDQFSGSPVFARVEPNINLDLRTLINQGLDTSQPWSVHYKGVYFADSATYDEYLFELITYQGSFIKLVIDGTEVSLNTIKLEFEDYVWWGKTTLEPNKDHYIELFFASQNSQGNNQISIPFLNFGATTLKVPDSIKEYDAVVVSIGFENTTNGESVDEPYDLPFYQEQLVSEACSISDKVILVTHNGGSVKTESYIDKVKTFIHAWYPGQAGGQALAEIIFGEVNPSAKLPITWEKTLSDVPAAANYPFGQDKAEAISYTEGLFGGYRGYEKNNIEPLFYYGFGLSYTTFALSDFSLSKQSLSGQEDSLTLTFTIKNNGTVKGAEVAQLYAGETDVSPENPIKTLKGFKKVSLLPGEQKQVAIDLLAKDLAYYDVGAKSWLVKDGSYNLYVGVSSKDILTTLKIAYSN